MTGGRARAGLEDVRAARMALGAELVGVREAAGYTQTGLAAKIGCGRSTLSASEHGHAMGSRDLWQRLDDALGAGGLLVRRRDEVAAMAVVAADEAVQAGVRKPGGRSVSSAVRGGSGDPITALRSCPACGGLILVTAELVTVEVPGPCQAAIALIRVPPPAARRHAGRAAGGVSMPGRVPGIPGTRVRHGRAAGQRRAAMPEFWAITRVPPGPVQAANWSAYGTAALVTGVPAE